MQLENYAARELYELVLENLQAPYLSKDEILQAVTLAIDDYSVSQNRLTAAPATGTPSPDSATMPSSAVADATEQSGAGMAGDAEGS